MPTRDEMIADIRRQRMIDEIRAARSASSSLDSAAGDIASGLKAAGKGALDVVGDVSDFVSSYTGAPVRAGIGAKMEGGSFVEGYKNQFGEPTAAAPTGEELLAKAGVPKGPDIPLPLNISPTGEKLKVTPRGIAGSGVDILTDPTTYVAPLAEAGLSAVGPKLPYYLRSVASNVERVGKNMNVTPALTSGLAGAGGYALLHGASLPQIGTAIVSGLALKGAQKYGPGVIGGSLRKLANLAASPTMAKWAAPLSKAAASGESSLLVTHHLLMNSDPEYRKALLGDEQ